MEVGLPAAMRIESKSELRRALEQRTGASVDDVAWASLEPDWSPPYDNADLRELVQHARRIRPPERRSRRPRHFANAIPRNCTLDLQEDVERVRELLACAWEALVREPMPTFSEVERGVVLSVFFAQWRTDLDLPHKPSRARGNRALLLWWRQLVGESSRLAQVHRIRVSEAITRLTGWQWPSRNRNDQDLLALEIHPFLAASELLGHLHDVGKRHMDWPLLPLYAYLKRRGWRTGENPPGGSWDEARKQFNSDPRNHHPLLPDRRGRRYDSADAFRKAAGRAMAREAKHNERRSLA